MEMLTNVETGMFAPLEYQPGQLIALEFERDGMCPVKLERSPVADASAIRLYGQRAYDNNRQALEQVGLLRDSLPREDFGDVYRNITPYHVVKEMRFAGAYPFISGFTDADAWNHVTPVLGYRAGMNDPVGLSAIKLSLGVSPWSRNAWKNRLHASRKGYMASLAYDYSNDLITPYKREWGFSVATYGDMDALPMYQEIAVDDVKSMQTAQLYGKISKLRKSLGGVMDEQGYRCGCARLQAIISATPNRCSAIPTWAVSATTV